MATAEDTKNEWVGEHLMDEIQAAMDARAKFKGDPCPWNAAELAKAHRDLGAAFKRCQHD